jgi:hypothetical protein
MDTNAFKVQPSKIQEKQKRDVLIKKYMRTNTVNPDIRLTYNVIDKLQLTKRMSRQQRRLVARKVGMDWDFYKLLEFEVMKRIKAKVNLETGLPSTDVIPPNNEEETKN